MFQAQLLITKSTAYSVYGPWFPRGGDNVRVVLETVDLLGSPDLEVQLMHKNSEDPGPGTAVGSAVVSAGEGRVEGTVTGLEEMVRFRFDVTGTTSGDWVLFRMLSNVWYDDVHATL